MPDPVPVARRALLSSGAVVASAAAAGSAVAQPAADAAPLVAIMERYAAALRSNDVETLVGLYAGNGVFMRENLPAVAGTDSFNQLVVFRRVGGAWKIRCYLYASDRPGTGTPR